MCPYFFGSHFLQPTKKCAPDGSSPFVTHQTNLIQLIEYPKILLQKVLILQMKPSLGLSNLSNRISPQATPLAIARCLLVLFDKNHVVLVVLLRFCGVENLRQILHVSAKKAHQSIVMLISDFCTS